MLVLLSPVTTPRSLPLPQFVTCALNKQLPRIQSWRQHGYAVIMLDNRGSANRGVQFEAVVKVCLARRVVLLESP